MIRMSPNCPAAKTLVVPSSSSSDPEYILKAPPKHKNEHISTKEEKTAQLTTLVSSSNTSFFHSIQILEGSSWRPSINLVKVRGSFNE